MSKIYEKAWFWPVVSILALVILSRGAAIPVFASMIKFILPFAVIYGGYRLVKWRIKKSLMNSIKSAASDFQSFQHTSHAYRGMHQNQANNSWSTSEARDVIEICPKCGREKSSSCPDGC